MTISARQQLKNRLSNNTGHEPIQCSNKQFLPHLRSLNIEPVIDDSFRLALSCPSGSVPDKVSQTLRKPENKLKLLQELREEAQSADNQALLLRLDLYQHGYSIIDWPEVDGYLVFTVDSEVELPIYLQNTVIFTLEELGLLLVDHYPTSPENIESLKTIYEIKRNFKGSVIE